MTCASSPVGAWREQLMRGEFGFVGLRLAADIVIERNGRGPETITLRTAGLWSVESDSGEEYFRASVVEETEDLGNDLRAFCFTWDEIADAFPHEAAYEVVYR